MRQSMRNLGQNDEFRDFLPGLHHNSEVKEVVEDSKIAQMEAEFNKSKQKLTQ
jgi:hypothetical protein